MSADKEPELVGDYRRYLAALVLFHQAAADAVGLGATEYQASNLLDLDGPMTSSELARRMGLTSGATTRLVDRLVRAGLAERADDPSDRRRALVAHTGRLPEGLARTLDAVRTPIGAVVDGLDDVQLSGLRAYLRGAADVYAAASRDLR